MTVEIDPGFFQDGYDLLKAAVGALASVTALFAFTGIYPASASRPIVQAFVSGMTVVALIATLFTIKMYPDLIAILPNYIITALISGAFALALFFIFRPILSGTYNLPGNNSTVVIRWPVMYKKSAEELRRDGTRERDVLLGAGGDYRAVWPPLARCGGHFVLVTTWLISHLGILVGLLFASMLLANPMVFSQSSEDDQTRVESIPIQFVFEKDSSVLPDPAPEILNVQVAKITEFAPALIVVRGHADTDGTDAYNRQLTQDRATAVLGWLSSQGALAGIEMRAFGMSFDCQFVHEADTTGSELDRAQAHNRRVEILLFKVTEDANEAGEKCDLV